METAIAIQTAPASASEFLTQREVLARYRLSRPTLWEWRRRGIFPPALVLAPNVLRWRRSDLERWESERASSKAIAVA